MSHTTIYFLTPARDFDHAEKLVMGYLEGEKFFDYSSVLPEESGPLETKRNSINAFLNGWNWKEAAEAHLKNAEGYKAAGDLGMYGYSLIRAGELYAQYLTIDTYIFNIDSGDYSIPPPPTKAESESNGWWAIAVDFHY